MEIIRQIAVNGYLPAFLYTMKKLIYQIRTRRLKVNLRDFSHQNGDLLHDHRFQKLREDISPIENTVIALFV